MAASLKPAPLVAVPRSLQDVQRRKNAGTWLTYCLSASSTPIWSPSRKLPGKADSGSETPSASVIMSLVYGSVCGNRTHCDQFETLATQPYVSYAMKQDRTRECTPSGVMR